MGAYMGDIRYPGVILSNGGKPPLSSVVDYDMDCSASLPGLSVAYKEKIAK